jgi:hypothetical protein
MFHDPRIHADPPTLRGFTRIPQPSADSRDSIHGFTPIRTIRGFTQILTDPRIHADPHDPRIHADPHDPRIHVDRIVMTSIRRS